MLVLYVHTWRYTRATLSPYLVSQMIHNPQPCPECMPVFCVHILFPETPTMHNNSLHSLAIQGIELYELGIVIFASQRKKLEFRELLKVSEDYTG